MCDKHISFCLDCEDTPDWVASIDGVDTNCEDLVQFHPRLCYSTVWEHSASSCCESCCIAGLRQQTVHCKFTAADKLGLNSFYTSARLWGIVITRGGRSGGPSGGRAGGRAVGQAVRNSALTKKLTYQFFLQT